MTSVLLVTGAGGYLAEHLSAGLRSWAEQRGAAVVTTGRHDSGDEPGLDLADPAAVRSLLRRVAPTHVLHLAGARSASPQGLVTSNVVATASLLDALTNEPSLRRLVVLGSAAEYGEATGPVQQETDPERPVTDYGRSKLAQTMVVRAMASALTGSTVVLRPFNVVGPDMPRTTPLGNILRQLSAGTSPEPEVVCGRLDVVRDFLPVYLLQRAVVAALESEDPPRTVNVCTGRATVLGDLVEELARQLGRRPVVRLDTQLAAVPAPAAAVGSTARLTQLVGDVDVTTAELAEALRGVEPTCSS